MEKLTYKSLSQSIHVEIPKIKGSRFFATLIPVSSKSEIEENLSLIQSKYYDATHNCYARRLGTHAHQDLFGNRSIHALQERANDDGEPSNTAGKPILSVITGAAFFDILVVVTRYFGGTLLGVWGLIQAYTETTKAGIAALNPVFKEIKKKLTLHYRYDQLSQVQYLFNKYDAEIIEENYDSSIKQIVAINLAYWEWWIRELTDKQIERMD